MGRGPTMKSEGKSVVKMASSCALDVLLHAVNRNSPAQNSVHLK